MFAIAKMIVGASALASAGAVTLIDNAPAPVANDASLRPTIQINGKAVNRLSMEDGRIMSNAEINSRILMAHGLAASAATDCKAHAWPNIPAECISTSEGQPRRAVRLITTDGSNAAAPRSPIQPASTTAPARR